MPVLVSFAKSSQEGCLISVVTGDSIQDTAAMFVQTTNDGNVQNFRPLRAMMEDKILSIHCVGQELSASTAHCVSGMQGEQVPG